MATISAITETTTLPGVIYDPTLRRMVEGSTVTRRHYTVSSCGQDFTVRALYGEGDYDLIVHVHGGRDFRVGTDETPTIDAAVAAAIATAERLGLSVGISEKMTSENRFAQIDRVNAEHLAGLGYGNTSWEG